MVHSISHKIKLHTGVEMPQFGLGVFKIEDGNEAVDTVKTALNLGYRSIDTAAFYDNEEGVGQAIKDSGIPREELFITTKVWNTDQGYEETLAAFEKSRKKLGLEYIDLYLIHWPVEDEYLHTWKALERLYDEGKVKSIGVSNFQIHHLQDLFVHSKEKPVVNQVELHPLLSQKELRSFCKENDIAVEAWSPIARGRLLEDSRLIAIAEKYGKSTAQVILRWHLQNDVIIIPKSASPVRLKENADIFDFELTTEDMDAINQLNENKRFGPDPDNFNL
ncbi:aldo/keto reductase [Bacillus sp. V3B]|uniref:aldo/keto reductase n=1 Tax=Bacillus sp. V3B TaxID=2804915 RepID=UPI00210B0DA5|nr:aldo/keto reductase [Bacillus sp. V3B]MCQ6276757.1 aldo/keto reductase [Bacillus sp. V3B]